MKKQNRRGQQVPLVPPPSPKPADEPQASDIAHFQWEPRCDDCKRPASKLGLDMFAALMLVRLPGRKLTAKLCLLCIIIRRVMHRHGIGEYKGASSGS